MKAIALARIDPSIAVSSIAAAVALAALGAAEPIVRPVRLLVEIVWLYVSNTTG